MFSQIRPEELPIWVDVLTKDTIGEDGTVHPAMTDAKEIHRELKLIDNLLTVQKSKSLLNKKHGYKKILAGIIAHHIGTGEITPGSSNVNFTR